MLAMVTPMEAERCHVLVVDDDDDVREVLTLLLEEHGYQVTTSSNGAQALEHLQSGLRPGAILLDLMMPVMSGWDFWDHVQQSPSYRNIPIIVLTATGLTHGAIGGAPVLPKPVGHTELLALVSSMCASASAP